MITSTKIQCLNQTEVRLQQIAFDQESAIPTDNSAVCSLLYKVSSKNFCKSDNDSHNQCRQLKGFALITITTGAEERSA